MRAGLTESYVYSLYVALTNRWANCSRYPVRTISISAGGWTGGPMTRGHGCPVSILATGARRAGCRAISIPRCPGCRRVRVDSIQRVPGCPGAGWSRVRVDVSQLSLGVLPSDSGLPGVARSAMFESSGNVLEQPISECGQFPVIHGRTHKSLSGGRFACLLPGFGFRATQPWRARLS